MKVTTLGIDLAKNMFQLHGVNEFGKSVINNGPRPRGEALEDSSLRRERRKRRGIYLP